MLVSIDDSMSNEQVLDAFENNELKNPRNPNKTASRNTFKRYLERIQILRRMYYGIKDPKVKVYSDFEFLRDTTKILKMIKDNFSSNSNTYSTTVNSISAVLARLNHFHDVYLNSYMPLNTSLTQIKKTENKEKENLLTDEEKQNYLPWNKILQLEPLVKATEINPIENTVIYYLYTQIPPRRVGDYESLKIAIDNKEF